jgi:class 3 adenylate cyclase
MSTGGRHYRVSPDFAPPRVPAVAEPSQVLVPFSVRDQVARSGIGFDDKGDFQLKGVAGTWRVVVAEHVS